jgi:acyl-CoA-binding protein
LAGLYNQATIGDVNTDKPGRLDGKQAMKNWDCWESEKGKP